MLRPNPDLPLDRDASARYLPWLIAVMVYLAALGLAGALVMNKVVARWSAGLDGVATVQIPPEDPAGGGGGRADRLERAVEVLLATDGVTGAEILAPEEIAQLVEPWLGAGADYGDLPLPDLVAVTFDPAAAPDLDRLAVDLARAVPGAVLGDHQRWLSRLTNVAHSIELVASLVVALVGFAAVATVIFATRMGLSLHAPIIELLHLIGAQDAYVAAQFESHALRLTLRGGVLGVCLAAITVLLLQRIAGGLQDLPVPGLALGLFDWLLVIGLPLIVAAIAMATARFTVLRTLGRLP
jgi:cell division transport system permease protein